jgi:hypothetical protein
MPLSQYITNTNLDVLKVLKNGSVDPTKGPEKTEIIEKIKIQNPNLIHGFTDNLKVDNVSRVEPLSTTNIYEYTANLSLNDPMAYPFIGENEATVNFCGIQDGHIAGKTPEGTWSKRF